MSDGAALDLPAVIAGTWPAASLHQAGRFVVPCGKGGGNRVSAARLADPEDTGHNLTGAELAVMEGRQAELKQPPVVMVFDHQSELGAGLQDAGYTMRDATCALGMPCSELAAPPPPVTCFAIWPPLAIQEDIWAAGGVSSSRLAVMARAEGPKTSLFGRVGDRPAGTAFVAIHSGIAVVHALEIAASARRKGLAQLMMRAAADWGQRAGADTLLVLVTRENLPAQRLYTSLQLRPVGQYHYRVKSGGSAST